MKMKAQVKKKIGRFQPIKVEYELVEYGTARVRNDRNLAKVGHSQRINYSLISCWVITEREGTIVSAHCLGCKAGLAESCSHVASVLRPRFVQIPTDQRFPANVKRAEKYSNSSVCAPASNVVVFSLCPHFLQS